MTRFFSLSEIKTELVKIFELGVSVAFVVYYLLTKITSFACEMLIDEVKLRYNI